MVTEFIDQDLRAARFRDVDLRWWHRQFAERDLAVLTADTSPAAQEPVDRTNQPEHQPSTPSRSE